MSQLKWGNYKADLKPPSSTLLLHLHSHEVTFLLTVKLFYHLLSLCCSNKEHHVVSALFSSWGSKRYLCFAWVTLPVLVMGIWPYWFCSFKISTEPTESFLLDDKVALILSSFAAWLRHDFFKVLFVTFINRLGAQWCAVPQSAQREIKPKGSHFAMCCPCETHQF